MSEAAELGKDLVRMVLDAVANLPRTVVKGKLLEIQETIDPATGLTTGIAAVAVSLPAGRTECEWLGGFAAEVVAHQPVSLVGRDCQVGVIDGRVIVQGVIWTGA